MGVVVFGVWYMEDTFFHRGAVVKVLDSLYNVRNNIEGLVSLDDGARVL